MEETNIRFVVWDGPHGLEHLDDRMKNGIRKCMIQYGYGYEYVVEMVAIDDCLQADAPGWTLVADGPVAVDDDIMDMILDYYQGDSDVDKLLDAKGRPITLREAV